MIVMVDCGTTSADPPPVADLVPEASKGVRRVDYLFLTGPTRSHYNALPGIPTGFEFGTVCVAGSVEQYGAAQAWLNARGAIELPAPYGNAFGPYLSRGSAQLYILAVNASGDRNAADPAVNAMVLLLTYGTNGVLLLGDATSETWLLAKARLETGGTGNALKGLTSIALVGHPDAASAVGAPWIDAPGWEVTDIAVGPDPVGATHQPVRVAQVAIPGEGRPSASPLVLDFPTSAPEVPRAVVAG
ncbi:hypothetical protein [Kitasatospora atroaurantiaca]|uniref:hypothetical protein n=1 Tax=Kitasatospora atroaurantiaca TaxID=285545 RepID=UPI0011A9B8DF|nr:hypothetical protein [Kitasatospora atroaurantiaca]